MLYSGASPLTTSASGRNRSHTSLGVRPGGRKGAYSRVDHVRACRTPSGSGLGGEERHRFSSPHFSLQPLRDSPASSNAGLVLRLLAEAAACFLMLLLLLLPPSQTSGASPRKVRRAPARPPPAPRPTRPHARKAAAAIAGRAHRETRRGWRAEAPREEGGGTAPSGPGGGARGGAAPRGLVA